MTQFSNKSTTDTVFKIVPQRQTSDWVKLGAPSILFDWKTPVQMWRNICTDDGAFSACFTWVDVWVTNIRELQKWKWPQGFEHYIIDNSSSHYVSCNCHFSVHEFRWWFKQKTLQSAERLLSRKVALLMRLNAVQLLQLSFPTGSSRTAPFTVMHMKQQYIT